MDKNQFDEVLINALYLLGGTNETPFKDIIFFEEDINDEVANKILKSLDGCNDDYPDDNYLLDKYLDNYYDDLDDYDDIISTNINDLIKDIQSKIDVDKIAKDVMKRITDRNAITIDDMLSSNILDTPIIILDPDIYKDLDVNKYNVTLNNFKKLSNSDLCDIEKLKKEIEDLNNEMLNMVNSQIKDKKLINDKHDEKYKKIEALYDTMCDRKTEDVEKLMNEFCEYIISSKYCENKPSVIALIASSTMFIRNYIVKCLDDIFTPIIKKASKDTDMVLLLLDL